MTRMLVVAAAVSLLAAALAACGGGGDTQTVTETVSEETTTTEKEEGSGGPPVSAGDSATAGGIEITVTNAKQQQTLDLVGGEYRPDTPQAEHLTIKAPQGGSYVYVVTKLLNESSEGIDLTCSAPLQVKLRGAEGRHYDPVEELSEISGNPECNELLQPGFSHKMTWAFLVPPSAEPEALEFGPWFDEETPPAAIALPNL